MLVLCIVYLLFYEKSLNFMNRRICVAIVLTMNLGAISD